MSEVGRFPRLNTLLGKDHFPEAPAFFFVAGINSGAGTTFGRTDKRMAAVPVSLKSGRDVSVGGTQLTLDDVGATMLRMAGLKPELYGYTGRLLEFVAGA